MCTQVDLEVTATATTMGITAGRVVTLTPGQGKITLTSGQGKMTLAPDERKGSVSKTCPQASIVLFCLSCISHHWIPCN